MADDLSAQGSGVRPRENVDDNVLKYSEATQTRCTPTERLSDDDVYYYIGERPKLEGMGRRRSWAFQRRSGKA